MSVSNLLRSRETREPGAKGGEDKARPISDALAVIAAYVPTEVIGFYTLVLGLTAGEDPTKAPPMNRWWFTAIMIGTPIFVWLVAAVRAREASGNGKPSLPWSPSRWPIWEMLVAVVGLIAWSAVLPRSMFQQYGWYDPTAATLVLVALSIFLPLVGRLVQPKPAAS